VGALASCFASVSIPSARTHAGVVASATSTTSNAKPRRALERTMMNLTCAHVVLAHTVEVNASCGSARVSLDETYVYMSIDHAVQLHHVLAAEESTEVSNERDDGRETR
jgi:hypothetical protein